MLGKQTTIEHKERDGLLHIEAPGCIVNIRPGLADSEGHPVTSVEIICDARYGEPAWLIPDFDADGLRVLNVRVRRETVGPKPSLRLVDP